MRAASPAPEKAAGVTGGFLQKSPLVGRNPHQRNINSTCSTLSDSWGGLKIASIQANAERWITEIPHRTSRTGCHGSRDESGLFL